MNVALTQYLFNLISNTEAETIDNSNDIFITSAESGDLSLYVNLSNEGYKFEIWEDGGEAPLEEGKLLSVKQLQQLMNTVTEETP